MPVAVAVAYKEQIKHLDQAVPVAVAVVRGHSRLKAQLLEPQIQAAAAAVDVKRL